MAVLASSFLDFLDRADELGTVPRPPAEPRSASYSGMRGAAPTRLAREQEPSVAVDEKRIWQLEEDKGRLSQTVAELQRELSAVRRQAEAIGGEYEQRQRREQLRQQQAENVALKAEVSRLELLVAQHESAAAWARTEMARAAALQNGYQQRAWQLDCEVEALREETHMLRLELCVCARACKRWCRTRMLSLGFYCAGWPHASLATAGLSLSVPDPTPLAPRCERVKYRRPL